MMVKRVSAAQAKAQLSAIASEVAHGGPHVIIERRNKPWVALVRVSDLERLGAGPDDIRTPPGRSRPGGSMAGD